MIFFAVAWPIPGNLSNSASVALFKSTFVASGARFVAVLDCGWANAKRDHPSANAITQMVILLSFMIVSPPLYHVLECQCQRQTTNCLHDLWVLRIEIADLVHDGRVLSFRMGCDLLNLAWRELIRLLRCHFSPGK